MSNDSEKTMRPNAEADKTTRPTVQVDKTMRPDVQADKTMRPEAQPNKTMRPDVDSTLRPQKQQDEINRIINQDETEFILGNKVKYQVVRVISKSTGEADIFLVENKGKQFVLKLYFIGYKQDHSILNIVSKNAGSGLLVDTLEHGVWTNPQTQQERDYELMIYCEGGSLDQFEISHDENGEKLLGEIALKCACSLDFLHKQHIIHGDVKPANFFFPHKDRNVEDLALADFGIAKQCNKDGVVNIPYQERTKIYAAPEYYDFIQGEIQISTKTDFFALGMTLLTLWCGEESFSKMNEFQLKDHKKHGTLSYPKDMSDRTSQLIRALTLPNPNVRASLDEVVRWTKGEDICDLKSEKDDVRQFKILFNSTKNQIADSPEKLAEFMLEDIDLSVKYLYSGKIRQWLADNLRPELAQEIEDIAENQYPKDKYAGLYSACYHLDRGMPYTDIKNKTAQSSEEIAQSLLANFSHYQKALSNKNDSLFLFLNAHGAANITQTFAPLFKKTGNNRDALLQLIYTLDPTLHWIITTEENEKIECYTPEDVIKTKHDYSFSDESWDDLLGEAFLTWLRYKHPDIEGKIRLQKDYKERQTVVLYNLSPKVSYNFQTDKDADDYFFTAEEVGNYMNIQIEDFIKDENDEYASTQLDMMCDIDDTRLYDYFKSKGVYDDKIRWIKGCADQKSKDNVNKAGPYNWVIGVYKAIKGLGYDPYYYFPKSEKRVYTLGELNQISSKEIEVEIKKGYLQKWLTIFYQEDPDLGLAQKYTFEKETVKYLEHLEKLEPDNSDVENYRIGKNSVLETLSYLKRRLRFHLISKVAVGLLTLAAAALVIFGLLTIDIPLNPKDHVEWISIVAIVAGIAGVGLMYFAADSGCLIDIIVGAIVGGVTYFIIYFLLAFVGYIGAALLLTALVLLLIFAYIKYPVDSSSHNNLLDPTFEELELEPLHFAFSDDQTFRSSIEDDSYEYADYLSEGTKKFYKRLILPWVLILGMGALVVWASAKEGQWKILAQTEQEQYNALAGEWSGIFDGKNAVLTINSASTKQVDATISVKYTNLLTETLKGQIDLDKRSIHLDDVYKDNGNLDGEYNGSFNDNFTEFTGIYQNYKTKKTVDFNFKKGSPASQAETQPVKATASPAKANTQPAVTNTQPAETKTQQAESPQQAANNITIGTWSLTGKDTSAWTAKLVIESVNKNTFTGYMDWYRDGGDYSGREYFQGTFNENTRGITLQGTKLENANGLALGLYRATLSANGEGLKNGTWGGSAASGVWEAQLDK